MPAGTFPLPLWLDESERRYRTVSTDVPLWTATFYATSKSLRARITPLLRACPTSTDQTPSTRLDAWRLAVASLFRGGFFVWLQKVLASERGELQKRALRESDTPTLYNFIRKFYTLIRALN